MPHPLTRRQSIPIVAIKSLLGRLAMNRIHAAILACSALVLGASAAPSTGADYDALPDGTPSEIAQLFHSALAVPNVADWHPQDRTALLDVATLRYKNRLIDRAPAASQARALRHIEQLAQSALASEFPNALRQTCAQYGLTEGPCAQHRGYVNRALLLEEMLAQGQLTLERMETELAGAPRPKLAAWRQSAGRE